MEKRKTAARKDYLSIIDRWMPWTGGIVFALLAGIMLVGQNSDYLLTVQERSLFTPNETFWNEIMAKPGGFFRWMGCYLTQYFYYPAVGSSMLILIWIATYGATLKAFRLKKSASTLALIPLFALLASVIDLGYWLYYMKHAGYWFSESLSFLILILATWGYSRLRSWWKIPYLAAWAIAGYPLLGWYALLGVAIMGIITTKKCAKAIYGTAIAAILFVPYGWYHYYTEMRIEDAWTSKFPLFQLDKYTSWITSIPFFILIVATILAALIYRFKDRIPKKGVSPKQQVAMALVAVIASCTGVWMANFDDYNYHTEMRMYRHVEKGEWMKALEEVKELPDAPTRQMVLLKNIALMNIGKMGDRMYHYDNGGKLPHKRDELTIHMAQTAAPLIYFQYGKLNFATRWSIENSVETGFSVNNLKILAYCALLNGEWEAADKYASLLEQTTFHKEVGEEIKQWCKHPEQIEGIARFKSLRELHRHAGSTLDSDAGFCEIYLLHYFSKTSNIDSRLFQEVTLNHAMASKDIQLFWPRFFQYAHLHQGEEMPIHYQEAAYLYGNLEKNVNIEKMPFDKKKVVDRYTQFNSTIQYHLKKGLNEQEIAEITRSRFGNTFWWFYFFSNNVDTY